jgi:hypothetical protein
LKFFNAATFIVFIDKNLFDTFQELAGKERFFSIKKVAGTKTVLSDKGRTQA